MMNLSPTPGHRRPDFVRVLLLATAAILLLGRIVRADAVIAEWNVACGIELGAGHTGRPIPPERIKRIGEIIAQKIQPDVIVLSEVFPAHAAADIAAAATKAGWKMQATVVPKQPAGCTQFLAFLKRPGVRTSGTRALPGTEAADFPSTRRAIITKARVGAFDFYLVGVHFKSARGKPERTARDGQCARLADQLAQLDKATAHPEHDFLVVGDYNMIPAQDASNFAALNRHSTFRFLSNSVLGTTHVGACNAGVPVGNHLDGYAIATPATQELISGTMEILNHERLGLPCSAFLESSPNFVSDHFPLRARFRTDQDDD